MLELWVLSGAVAREQGLRPPTSGVGWKLRRIGLSWTLRQEIWLGRSGLRGPKLASVRWSEL
eukprot:1081776-Alexandrium_andersonii.AAC.1